MHTGRWLRGIAVLGLLLLLPQGAWALSAWVTAKAGKSSTGTATVTINALSSYQTCQNGFAPNQQTGWWLWGSGGHWTPEYGYGIDSGWSVEQVARSKFPPGGYLEIDPDGACYDAWYSNSRSNFYLNICPVYPICTTNGSGNIQMQVFLDGQLIGSKSGADSVSFTLTKDKSAFSAGSHTVVVNASDSSGATASATASFTGSGSSASQSWLGGSDAVKNSPSCPLKKAQTVGNPIALATGDKEQTEHDFTIGNGPMALSMVRSYHSQSDHDGHMGYGWTWSYGWELKQPNAEHLTIRRADGKQMSFQDDGSGIFTRQTEMSDEKVVKTAAGWRYTRHDRSYVDFDASGRLTALHAEDGRAITVAYDSAGNPVSVTGPYGRELAITADGKGRISAIVGPLGRQWTYAYDAADNLTSVNYPDGTTRQYLYEDTKHPHGLTGIVDTAGRRYATFAYDDQGRAALSDHPLSGERYSVAYNADGTITVTEPDGATRTYTKTMVNGMPVIDAVSDAGCGCGSSNSFTLDNNTGLLMASQNLAGTTTQYSYDANGRLLTETQAVGTPLARTLTYTYDAAGHPASFTDAMGATTRYAYDALGHRVSETDALGHVTRWAYNADGTLASHTAADGGVTAYGYDQSGDVTSITFPDGSVRRMAYDAAGRLVSSTDAMGATTRYAYDARDHLLSVSYADGGQVTNSYDAAGDRVSTTGAAGLTTNYVYDAEHRPVQVTRPDGSVLNLSYDGKGNLVSREVVDAGGVVAASDTMRYDADDRLLSTTHADGSQVTDSYDEIGDLLTVTDEAGRVRTNTYDVLRRLVSSTDANDETVDYAYDAANRRTSVTAANGATTRFAYDALGELTREVSPDRGTTSYSYGPTGDVASKTDGNGIVSDYRYDAMHRLTGIDYPSDSLLDVTLAYDADGRVTRMADASGVTSYARDIMGRTTDAAWTPEDSGRTVDVGYGYDAGGRLASMTYPSGRVVSYHYSPGGRIQGVDATVDGGSLPLVSNIGYSALGAVASRTLGNGIVETRSYDNRGRLTSIAAGSVLSRTLDWSPASTVKSITDGVDAAASQSFGYDAVDRLTSATGLYGSLSYTYDANGNRMSRTDADGTASYSYQSGTNLLQSAGSVSYTRDAAGNRLSDGYFFYTYGADNRLASVSRMDDDGGSDVLASYVYNGRGERAIKRLGREGERATWYVYDLSGHLIAELRAHGGRGRVQDEYVYGPSGRLATIAVHGDDGRGKADRSNGGGDDASESVYWHINDHLGTPQALTDRRGRVVWAADYLPFGGIVSPRHGDGEHRGHGGDRSFRHWKVVNNFRFPGQYYDAETGLNYNYHRDYDPMLGRYIENDPIGLYGGLNPFGYVNGNPISEMDQSGQISPIGIIGLGALAGGGGAFAGTLMGGGSLGDVFAAIPGGALGGASSVAIVLATPESLIGYLSAIAADFSINAALDANTVAGLFSTEKPKSSNTTGAACH